MSLHLIPPADLNSKTEFDRESLPPEPRGSGLNKNDGSGAAPAMTTKKRKREVGDYMDVGGATSEESGDEGVEYVPEQTSSEPAFKRRRTLPVDDATRQRVSDAITGGDQEALKKILAACPGCLNYKSDSSHATPLLEAVWWGQTGIVRWLLEQGADPNLCCTGYYAEHCTDTQCTDLDEALRERYRLKLEALEGLISVGAYVLGQSALVHASLHGDMELIKLLVSFKAEVNGSGNGMTPLMGAVAAAHADIVRHLLHNGAEPAKECEKGNGDMQEANALSTALCLQEMEIFQMMLATLAEGQRAAALQDAIARSADTLSVATLESLTESFPQWMSTILQSESPTGQSWLLELVLDKWNLELVRFLIDQGSVYKFRSDKDLSIAANVSPDKELIALMLKSIDSPDLRGKFASLCLYRNLYFRTFHDADDEVSDCNRWLIAEALVLPLFVPEVDINLGENPRMPVDHLFHAAVSTGAEEEVFSFLQKYGVGYFHFIGKQGKFPIELATTLDDSELFTALSHQLSSGNKDLELPLWSQLFERAAMEHQDAKAYEFLKNRLVQVSANFAFDTLISVANKAIYAQYWKALEFIVTRAPIVPTADLINKINSIYGEKRIMINDILFLIKSFNFTERSHRDRDCWENSVSASQVLDALSRQVGKSSEKFMAGCTKLGRASGMTGIVMERSIETQAMLSFIRQALLGSGSNPDGFGSQFSNFIAYWLPVTDAWHWYLTSDSMYNQAKAPSSEFCDEITRLSLRQIDDLHQAGKRWQDGWARQIYGELPALCLRCVDMETDELDRESLQHELIQRDIVAPNAIRLASLMQRAYQSARALTASALQSPARQLQQFSMQFAIELAKLINDSEDRQVSQRISADTMQQLDQFEYRRLNLPTGMTPEFELQAQEILAELAWWQLDALFRCFGKSVDGQADAYTRDYGPFLKLKNEFKEKKYLHGIDLSQIRRGLENTKIGSGPRRESFYS